MPTLSRSHRPVRRAKSSVKISRATPDPFSAPLSVFETEILFLLEGKSLAGSALKSELRNYGETELSEWRHLDVSLPSTLTKLTEQGWVRCNGEKYTLTPQAHDFVGTVAVE